MKSKKISSETSSIIESPSESFTDMKQSPIVSGFPDSPLETNPFDRDSNGNLYIRKFYLPKSSENALYRTNRPHLPMNEVSRNSSSSSSEKNEQEGGPNTLINSNHIQENIDVDWSMKMMDKLWNASLYEFIKDEENCECTARYVSQIMKEYTIQQSVQGLQWLLGNWRPEMKARFLRICFADFDPELAGNIFGALSKDWEFERDLTINTALILLKEPAPVASDFIVAMTKSWKPDKVTELISCLDCVLDWTEDYFQDFTGNLIKILREQQEKGVGNETEMKRVEELLKHLSLLYEVNLAETNLRLALADYQLALAEHKLRTVTRILAADADSGSHNDLTSDDKELLNGEQNDDEEDDETGLEEGDFVPFSILDRPEE